MSLILPETLNELKPLPNWVVWTYEGQDEKPKKVPKNPRTGKNASPTNPDTWTDFDTAAAADKRMGLSENRTGGIGFMFGVEPSGYAGIDIDNCIAKDGSLSDMATEIVRIMDTYTEISASGHGLHILFKLDVPFSEIGSRMRNDAIGLEIYDCKRYFAMTGNVYGEPKPIAERTKELKRVYELYMAKPEKTNSTQKPETPTHNTTVDSPVDTSRTAMKAQDTQHGNTEDLSDSELWDVMFASKHGRRIQKLYNGDCSDYNGDDSDADMAMCNYLAWWTHGDSSRVDRMFRQTGLMRPKWDERRGAQTYGAMTIAKALNNIYEPQEIFGHVQEQKPAVMPDIDIELSTDRLSTGGGSVLAPYTNTIKTHDSNMPVTTEWTPPITGFEYVENGSFLHELQQFQKLPPVFSGIQNFDNAQGGFVPGLYVLGATPSLGKTTFMSQIADNIAAQGYSVLFFSLEQSRLEMTTKSLSRITAQIDSRAAISSINIRRGNFINDNQRRLVDRAIAKYQEFSRNISIIECEFDTTVSTISETVKRFIDFTGLRPIVIVDYLQILQADKDNQGGRDAIECVIRALKRLQVDNSLILFVISSFNRSNYSVRVDYASFKESGLIEYSCDVLLGMQPTIMAQDSLFVKEKADKAQREAIEEAVKKNPRKVMLKNLKNRYGKRGYSCGFVYDARFDLFVPDENFKENGHDTRTIL